MATGDQNPLGGGQDAGPAAPFSGNSSVRIGVVAFAPLRSESGVPLPVSFGTLPWTFGRLRGLSVIVKATFSLDSSPMRPRNAEPLHTADMMHADGFAVHAPSDMVPRRARADVSVWARALAPEGGEAQSVTVRLALVQDGKAVIDKSHSAAVGSPAGFGPVPQAAPRRRELLGTASLEPDADGVLTLPADFSFDFFQAAQPDQQLDDLHSDAKIVLEGMHPNRPVIDAALPGAWAAGTIFGLDRSSPATGTTLTFRPDTLVVDAERLLCSVVWRAEVSMRRFDRLAELTVAAGVATDDHPLKVPTNRDELASSTAPEELGQSLDATVAFTGDVAAILLPFVESTAGSGDHTMALSHDAPPSEALPFQDEASPKQPTAIGWAKKLGAEAASGTVMAPSTGAADAPLPFGEGKPKSGEGKPKSGEGKPKRSKLAAWAQAVDAGAHTVAPATAKPTRDRPETLPFGEPAPGSKPRPAALAWAEATGGASGETVALGGARSGERALPFGPSAEERSAEERSAEERTAEERTAEERTAEERTAEERSAEREAAQKAVEEEAAREEQREAEAAKQARERQELAERAKAEKRRFEEEQRRAREAEAKRQAAAKKLQRDDAKNLEDDLYGSFGPKGTK